MSDIPPSDARASSCPDYCVFELGDLRCLVCSQFTQMTFDEICEMEKFDRDGLVTDDTPPANAR